MRKLFLAGILIAGSVCGASATATSGNQGPPPTFIPTIIPSLPPAILPLTGSNLLIVDQLIGSTWVTAKVNASQAGITINGQNCVLGGVCNLTLAGGLVNGGTGISGGASGNVLIDTGGLLGEESTAAFVLTGGALGTPSSGNLANTTGFPIAGVTGFGAGVLQAVQNAVGAASGLVGLNASGYTPANPQVGITSGAASAAGNVGEIIASDIPLAGAVPATSATPLNITSIALTAGDWDCWGMVATDPAGSTMTVAIAGGLSTASATLPNPPGTASLTWGTTTASGEVLPAFRVHENISSGITLFLVGQTGFSVSTSAMYGHIECRRMR